MKRAPLKTSLNTLLLFTGLLWLSLPGCQCKKEQLLQTVNASLKKAFFYKPGTYWVYRDSISGRVDSFYVNYNLDTMQQLSGNNVEVCSVFFLEDSVGTSQMVQTWSIVLQQNAADLSCPFSNYSLYWQGWFSMPEQLGWNQTPGGEGLGFVSNIYPTYTLNTLSFNNVEEIFYNTQNGYASGNDDWFYVDTAVGIIKMRLNYPNDTPLVGNKVWELQRWHVVK